MTVYLKRQHNVAQYKQIIGDGTQQKNEPKNIKSQSHRSIIYCHCESTADTTYKTVSVLQFHVLRFHVLLFPVRQFHARDVQRRRVGTARGTRVGHACGSGPRSHGRRGVRRHVTSAGQTTMD